MPSKIAPRHFTPTHAAPHAADRSTHTADPDYGGVEVGPMTPRRFPAKLYTKCVFAHIPPLLTVQNSLSCTKTAENARKSTEIVENDPTARKNGRQTHQNMPKRLCNRRRWLCTRRRWLHTRRRWLYNRTTERSNRRRWLSNRRRWLFAPPHRA